LAKNQGNLGHKMEEITEIILEDTPKSVLPQQPPFLFVEEILALDEHRCLAKYTFKEDEWFFKGHLPGNPIVPGVILIEAMAQVASLVCIYNIAKNDNIPLSKVKESMLSVFVRIGKVEFLEIVRPKETIYIECYKNFYRFGRFETGGESYKLVNGKKKIVCTHKSLVGQRIKV